MHHAAGLQHFAFFGELAETTTQLLALDLKQETTPDARSRRVDPHDPVRHLVLQRTRDYLSEVREGFVLSVRTSQVSDRAEIRFLLERVLTDWTRLQQELGLEEDGEDSDRAVVTDSPAVDVEQVRRQLLAFGMAAIALGHLPRLPADQVTFPYSYSQPPTYADISAPDSPGEMLWRIEELEQMVWQVMAHGMRELVQRRYGALRRTYGFFEASALLARKELERFGIKGEQRGLSLL